MLTLTLPIIPYFKEVLFGYTAILTLRKRKGEKQIYDIVNASDEHMTAEQVYNELQKSSSTVSRATVYNNLNKLCDVKLIRRITLEDSPDRYDRISKHDHLVCQKRGKLVDICL